MEATHSDNPLLIDPEKHISEICSWMKDAVRHRFRRRGVVVALSGGVDSSVTAELCVQALGKEHVFGLLMPEKDSSGDTRELSRLIAEHLRIEFLEEDISNILEANGCYSAQADAVRSVLPEFQAHWQFKIVLPGLLEQETLRLFSLVAQDDKGQEHKARLTTKAYLQLVAATNFKQRIRKMREYYHSDRLNYTVAGTPNRLEYELGFFVKLGDGAADVKPIAHLYKTQVYQLAEYLNIPEIIRSQPPSTDTYSLPQTQEEFYFAVPYAQMDLCLYGKNKDLPAEDTARICGLTADQVERIYRDIDAKLRVADYLHSSPLIIADPLFS